MYVQGAEIDKKFNGSLEHRLSTIGEAIEDHFCIPDGVNVIATHEDHAYVVKDNSILDVRYSIKDGKVKIKSDKISDVPVIEDSDIPRYVSKCLKEIVESAMSGGEVSRTRVREIVQLIDKDENYWISDLINKIEESANGAEWSMMYEANQDRIRTSLYGDIRKLESRLPSTRFSSISKSKLASFYDELKESLGIICKITTDIVDECRELVFNKSQEDEFYVDISSSLISEAQTIGGLLDKAEKLMRSEDVDRMAQLHDGLVERAKTMVVVTEYLKRKSHQNEE